VQEQSRAPGARQAAGEGATGEVLGERSVRLDRRRHADVRWLQHDLVGEVVRPDDCEALDELGPDTSPSRRRASISPIRAASSRVSRGVTVAW
jgi:hypothetical protein